MNFEILLFDNQQHDHLEPLLDNPLFAILVIWNNNSYIATLSASRKLLISSKD